MPDPFKNGRLLTSYNASVIISPDAQKHPGLMRCVRRDICISLLSVSIDNTPATNLRMENQRESLFALAYTRVCVRVCFQTTSEVKIDKIKE